MDVADVVMDIVVDVVMDIVMNVVMDIVADVVVIVADGAVVITDDMVVQDMIITKLTEVEMKTGEDPRLRHIHRRTKKMKIAALTVKKEHITDTELKLTMDICARDVTTGEKMRRNGSKTLYSVKNVIFVGLKRLRGWIRVHVVLVNVM